MFFCGGQCDNNCASIGTMTVISAPPLIAYYLQSFSIVTCEMWAHSHIAWKPKTNVASDPKMGGKKTKRNTQRITSRKTTQNTKEILRKQTYAKTQEVNLSIFVCSP